MQEERMQILRMLEEGKIGAEDAARLLDALHEPPRDEAGRSRTKHLRIKVTEHGAEKPRVNLTLPISLAKIVAKLVPPKAKAKLAEEGIDLDTFVSEIMSENVGRVLDVEAEDQDIQISIE